VADKAGNTATATVDHVNIDRTAPTVTATPSPSANTYGWNNSDVTVTFGGSDALSGFDACDAPVVLSSEGPNQSATGNCTDKAGNSASATASGINIDKTAPLITASRAPAANANGWNNTDVTASYSASDALSGLANPPTGSYVFTTEGAGQSHTFSVTDKAGNSASAGVSDINIDKTAPTINAIAPAQGGTYTLNGAFASNYTCSDSLSGLDYCGGPVASGANFSTGTPGANSFTVNATDKAGNAAQKVNDYTVQYLGQGTACLGEPGHTILQPIEFTGKSAFKRNSTAPAKFRVCDANGNSIGTPGVVTSFRLVQVLSGTDPTSVDEAPLSTTPDSAFRWTGEQWIFNISTKNLTANRTYVYEIKLNDLSTIGFQFAVK
jgi:hypothetical protein